MEFECQDRVISVSKEMSDRINQLKKVHEETLKTKEAEYDKKVQELETQLKKSSTVQDESAERIAQMKLVYMLMHVICLLHLCVFVSGKVFLL